MKIGDPVISFVGQDAVSRRSTQGRLGAGGLGLALAARTMTAGAQSATPLVGGKIRRSSDDADALSILIHLGAVPVPGGTASPMATPGA